METQFEHCYVLNVLSGDHPGIIAAVTGAIVKLGGNIESVSQTVVEGYFTLTGIISAPEPKEPETLADAIRQADPEMVVDVIARPFAPPPERGRRKTEQFVITAFGADAPGVLHRFAAYLAGKDINIVDFYADIRGDDLVLISQVEVPARYDVPILQAELEEIAAEIGYTVRIQHENIFVATNQLRLTRQP